MRYRILFSLAIAVGCLHFLDAEEAQNPLMELEKQLMTFEDQMLEEELPSFTVPEDAIPPANSPSEELISLAEEMAFISPVPLQSEIIPPIADRKAVMPKIEVSLRQVFSGSPIIYSLLFSMSLASIAVCLYALLRIKQQSRALVESSARMRSKLLEKDFSSVLDFCQNNPGLLSRIVLNGLTGKGHGVHTVLENMKAEGRRATVSFWQHLGILQDIAIIAPMLGLLGTVIGLFYAFYDLNRSIDSINNLLDGLGISVGTTVAGIGVAILAMLLHSSTKFRLVRVLAKVENEAASLANLMEDNSK